MATWPWRIVKAARQQSRPIWTHESSHLSERFMKRNWFRSPAHDPGRSLNIIRVVLAFILITHPVYALLHPANISGFGHFLETHRIPFGGSVAWGVMLLQVGCSLALATRRLVVPGC